MWRQARVECGICGHQWQAVGEVESRESMFCSLECPSCHNMAGGELEAEADPDDPYGLFKESD